MNCADFQLWIHAELDGELDAANSLELERHLNLCATCNEERRALQSLRDAFKVESLQFRAPSSLRKKATQMARSKTVEIRSENANFLWLWKALAIGATAFAAVVLVLRPGTMSEQEKLFNEATAGHIRSLMAQHLTDVASTDQHTVKPWFEGKLDFAPNVRDFAADNFPLVGGRLDYVSGRQVAALIYRRDKHFINVFTWPSIEATGKIVTANRRGFSIVDGSAGGLHYTIVSDLNAKSLSEFVGLLIK